MNSPTSTTEFPGKIIKKSSCLDNSKSHFNSKNSPDIPPNKSATVQNMEIQEEITIKEDPDDDLNLILECEDVNDQLKIKEEPIILNYLVQNSFTSTKPVQEENKEIPPKPSRKNNYFNDLMCILCGKKGLDEPLIDISMMESKIQFTTDINEHVLAKRACYSCMKMVEICFKFKKEVIKAHKSICSQKELIVPPDQLKALFKFHNKSFENYKEKETSIISNLIEPKKEMFECLLCYDEFSSEEKLQNHDIVAHMKLYCKLCNFYATDIKDYQQHQKKHSRKQMGEMSKVCCEKCGEIITTFRYNTHILEHESTKVLECPKCNCSVPDTLVKFHMKNHESKLVCERCGKHFPNKRNYQAHVGREHERRFVCKVCKKSFFNKTSLKNHLIVHTGDKPFLCRFCGKKFKDKHNINAHMRIHTNSFPYKCNYCEDKFRHNVTRKEHQKKKHPEKLKEDTILLMGKLQL